MYANRVPLGLAKERDEQPRGRGEDPWARDMTNTGGGLFLPLISVPGALA